MSNFCILCEDEVLSRAELTAVERAMDGFVETDVRLGVELVFVPADEIQRLNRETRAVDKVTDVLSYPSLDGIKGKALLAKDYPLELDEDGALFIGSVAVCHARAKEQAEEYGHSLNRELHYLLTHGVLHCLGYDHMSDEDKSEMREREEYVLKKLGIER